MSGIGGGKEVVEESEIGDRRLRLWRESGKAWAKTETVTPPSFSLPFPGGLYGWKWGVLSATSLAQTVPSALPKDQPERGEADDHRHRGSVPHRKAAHSPGIPHGELLPALHFGVYPRCGGSLCAPEVAGCCAVFVLRVPSSLFQTCCASPFQNRAVLLFPVTQVWCFISFWWPSLKLGAVGCCVVMSHVLGKGALWACFPNPPSCCCVKLLFYPPVLD